MYYYFRYLNPGGADPSQFYHNSETNDHQLPNFHTPSPYGTAPHGFSPPMSGYGYHDIPILHNLNSTLVDIQKKLTALEEKHSKTELALTEIQNSFDEMKENRVSKKVTSKKSPPGLSVSGHIHIL